jgi:hypothetical protein
VSEQVLLASQMLPDGAIKGDLLANLMHYLSGLMGVGVYI